MRRIQTRLQQRAAKEAAIQKLLHPPPTPEILTAALAALHGQPHPNDPWSFNSVLENQEGTEQAERFISIIRRTRRSPLVDSHSYVQALWDVCGLTWHRPFETWSNRGKAARSRFCSLAAHLTCKYPMPAFLFSVFFVPVEARAPHEQVAPHRNRNLMLQLYKHLAEGGSVKAAVQQGLLPVPLTKRMCHEFMQGPKDGDVYSAIRYAQTKAAGGSEALARALSATRLGRGVYDAEMERRLLTVIEWFSRQGMLNPDSVGPLFDYIEHRLRDPDFDITGRSVAAMQRAADEWHAVLRRQNPHATYDKQTAPSTFTRSGFESELIEYELPGLPKRTTIWSIDEILTLADLNREGGAMKHCVVSYWPRIASGTTSIWSLQKDGTRQLTLEVDNEARAVVQARGVCNKPPTPEQSRHVYAWAAKNHLRMGV